MAAARLQNFGNRAFRFIKKTPRETEARLALQKELYGFERLGEGGYPCKISCVSYDPALKVLYVGTQSGRVIMYGAPGVELSVDTGSPVTHLLNFAGQGRVVTALSNGQVKLWELQQLDDDRKPALVALRTYSLPTDSTLTSMVASGDCNNVFIGLVNDAVISLDVASWSSSLTLSKEKLNPVTGDGSLGGVSSISVCGDSADTVLVAYTHGTVVFWGRHGEPQKICSVTRVSETSNRKINIEFAVWPSADEFIVGYEDGAFSRIRIGAEADIDAKQPYGPFPCTTMKQMKISKLRGKELQAFTGGMPRANYGDRHTVAVVSSAKEIVFDFGSKVIDFVLLEEAGEANSLVVACEEELVAVDLTSDDWPLHRLPYLVSPHFSVVTSAAVVHDVPEEFWKKLLDIGESQSTGFSTRPWPITGGQQSPQKTGHPPRNDLLLTGHENGAISLWDASAGTMSLLYQFNTAPIFGFDFGPPPADDEEEWPPFRKVGVYDPFSDDPRIGVQQVALCPETETLVVGGTGGQVIVFSFSEREAELLTPAVTQNIVTEAEGFTWKGYDPMTVATTPVKYGAGFQPASVCFLYPPAAVTSLALNTKWKLVAAGTRFGLAVYDFAQQKGALGHCTLAQSELQATDTGVLSRAKTIKKSLRHSIRRLRKMRSSRGKKNPTQNAIDETRPEERSIEARGVVPEQMNSLVKSLYFADTFLLNQTSHMPCIFAGTYSGAILAFVIQLPAEESRDSVEVTCQLAKEMRLRHRAPVVHLSLIDRHGVPFSASCSDGKGIDMSDPHHQLIVVTEEQVKLFQLPTLKPLNKLKITAASGALIRSARVATFVSRKDERYAEHCLVFLNNAGTVAVISLPQLRPQLHDTNVIKETNASAILSCLLTERGEAFFPASPSSFSRVTFCPAAPQQPDFSVECEQTARLQLSPAVTAVSPTAEQTQETVAVSPVTTNGHGSEDHETDVTVTNGDHESSLSKDMTMDDITVHMKDGGDVPQTIAEEAH